MTRYFETFLLGFIMATIGLSCAVFGLWLPVIDPIWVLAAVVTLPLGVLLMVLSVRAEKDTRQ